MNKRNLTARRPPADVLQCDIFSIQCDDDILARIEVDGCRNVQHVRGICDGEPVIAVRGGDDATFALFVGELHQGIERAAYFRRMRRLQGLQFEEHIRVLCVLCGW